jgi:uncharacterized protein DUF5615
MTAIRFFTDEDVYGSIAPALRKMGVDATSTPEAGRLGSLDEDQLAWAASAGRVLVTFNVGDFAAHHAAWMRADKHHAGIIVSSQLAIGDVLRRLGHVATTLDADAMKDRLEFLSDW